MKVAGLFAGIGGLEVGFHRSGISTEFLCENWEPARAVLADRFGLDDGDIAGDISKVRSIPAVIDRGRELVETMFTRYGTAITDLGSADFI
jgi:DNA (cytosine-5)-methyltransferase 1